MTLTIDSSAPRLSYRRLAIVVTSVGLALAGVVVLLWPDQSTLVGYGLYTIPAHLLISVLANEPMLLVAAKSHPPIMVAIAGTAGCLVAIVLDYALIGWLVNHRLVKTEIDESRGFHTAQRFFGRAPFLLLVISAFLPVPFYPVKILAIARDYPLGRVVVALIVGKMPRFYLWALGGRKVQAPDSALLSAGIALGLMAGWGVWRTYRRNRARAGQSLK